MVDDHGNDPCRCRYLLLSRVYKAPPRTCAIVQAKWSGYGGSNSVIDLGKVAGNPSPTSRLLVERLGVEPN